ncbi:MAG: conjugal transfer protein TraA, partial [Azospira oryzae]
MHLTEDAHLPGGQKLREDYYSSEAAGVWHGSAAEKLGLFGDVRAEDFRKLAEGYSPRGEALVQNAGDPERRAAWDLTFSAPKDLSVIWAVGDEKTRHEIERVHDRAVAETLRELEERFGLTRRGQGGHETEHGGMVFAVFRHGTSRDLDPQLHSHAVALNLVARSDGTWGTLETREIYSHQKVLGAIYRSHLAHGLARMGYQITREGESFGIAGVPRELRDEWSKARHRIEAEMARLGVTGAKAAEMANLATRSKKNHDVTPEALRAGWAEHAREHGFGRDDVQKIRDSNSLAKLEKPDAKSELREATEHKAVLSEKELEYQSLVATVGHGREAARNFDLELKREAVVLDSPEKNKKVVYSTHEMVRTERDLMRMLDRGRNDQRHQLDEAQVHAAISRLQAAKGFSLSDEQKKAVLHLTSTAGRDKVLVGDAGTGKSTSMEALREAYQSAGYKVIGLA